MLTDLPGKQTFRFLASLVLWEKTQPPWDVSSPYTQELPRVILPLFKDPSTCLPLEAGKSPQEPGLEGVMVDPKTEVTGAS